MSKTLKWVLGIVAVLVVLALIAGGAWWFQNRAQLMTAYQLNAPRPNAPGPNAQATPGAPNGQNPPFGYRNFDDGRRYPGGGFGFGPMMGRRPFMNRGPFMPFGMGFFFLGGLFRLIIPLGILILVAILFYQLGRRAGRSTAGNAPAAPPADQNLPKTS